VILLAVIYDGTVCEMREAGLRGCLKIIRGHTKWGELHESMKKK